QCPYRGKPHAGVRMLKERDQNRDCSRVLKSTEFLDRFFACQPRIERLKCGEGRRGRGEFISGRNGYWFFFHLQPPQTLDQRADCVSARDDKSLDNVTKKIKVRVGFKLAKNLQIGRIGRLGKARGFTDHQTQKLSLCRMFKTGHKSDVSFIQTDTKLSSSFFPILDLQNKIVWIGLVLDDCNPC